MKTDEVKRGWPKLYRGNMVRGRHPKSKEWSMKGKGVEVGHGERVVFVVMGNRSSRLYKKEDVRLDTNKRYQGTRRRKAWQVNTSQAAPWRSSRRDSRDTGGCQ